MTCTRAGRLASAPVRCCGARLGGPTWSRLDPISGWSGRTSSSSCWGRRGCSDAPLCVVPAVATHRCASRGMGNRERPSHRSHPDLRAAEEGFCGDCSRGAAENAEESKSSTEYADDGDYSGTTQPSLHPESAVLLVKAPPVGPIDQASTSSAAPRLRVRCLGAGRGEAHPASESSRTPRSGGGISSSARVRDLRSLTPACAGDSG